MDMRRKLCLWNAIHSGSAIVTVLILAELQQREVQLTMSEPGIEAVNDRCGHWPIWEPIWRRVTDSSPSINTDFDCPPSVTVPVLFWGVFFVFVCLFVCLFVLLLLLLLLLFVVVFLFVWGFIVVVFVVFFLFFFWGGGFVLLRLQTKDYFFDS